MELLSPLTTYDRVRQMTPRIVNRKIDFKTEQTLREIESSGPEAIWKRLDELDHEWDIDRAVMALFATVIFAQTAVARATRNTNWLRGVFIQSPFLLAHAVFGWCPPVLLLRPLGFRTRQEIDAEKDELWRWLER